MSPRGARGAASVRGGLTDLDCGRISWRMALMMGDERHRSGLLIHT